MKQFLFMISALFITIGMKAQSVNTMTTTKTETEQVSTTKTDKVKKFGGDNSKTTTNENVQNTGTGEQPGIIPETGTTKVGNASTNDRGDNSKVTPINTNKVEKLRNTQIRSGGHAFSGRARNLVDPR